MKLLIVTITIGRFLPCFPALLSGGMWVNQSAVNAHMDVAVRVVAFYFPWELILLQFIKQSPVH